MTTTLTTVSDQGILQIPAEVQASLGILPGSEIEIAVDEDCIRLTPIKEPISWQALERAIHDLQDIFKGQPSLEDDLYEMRRAEEEHSRRKYGC